MPTSAREVLAALMQQYTGHPVQPQELLPIKEGASGRTIMRAHGLLGIYWTAERADNHSFLPAARGLAAQGIRVPALLGSTWAEQDCAACLVQDLGRQDLLSLREAPLEQIREAYTVALQALVPFHRIRPDWPLQPAFDAALYRWEQEYFAEHFLARHMGKNAADFLAHPALQEMATWLAGLPRVPIHRDCQSQNIMLHAGEAWFIDFQGMRMGLAEYDIASLLYDPYMALPASLREELLQLWPQLGGRALEPHVLAACAMQRLMQALGAFANIGYNRQREWYLQQISPGVAALREVALHAPESSLPAAVAACLLPILAD